MGAEEAVNDASSRASSNVGRRPAEAGLERESSGVERPSGTPPQVASPRPYVLSSFFVATTGSDPAERCAALRIPRLILPAGGWLRLAAFLVIMAAIVKCAWICDDSFITMRSVDNLLHGRGLTWNPGERVQVFTHPLWLLVLTVADLLSPSAWWAAILSGLVVSAAVVALVLARLEPRAGVVIAVAAALALSRAFVDYATSGLENPLACLLVVLALRRDLPLREAPMEPGRRLGALALAGSLLALTRLDLALLVLPVLGDAVLAGGWRQRRHWRTMALAALPLVAWEVFALVYFGFPLPNTAYAKLGAGVDGAELVRRGWWYFEATLRRDPLTAGVIVSGLAWVALRGDRRRRLWAAGALLYLAYIVRIGGDFMIGRFLVVPLVMAVVLAADLLPTGRRIWLVVGVLLLGFLNPRNPLTSPVVPPFEYWFRGVADERGYYCENTGLLPRLRPGFVEQEYVIKGRQAREIMDRQGTAFQAAECIGFYGYYAGPKLHVIDVMALADPFLARLPMRSPDKVKSWRIGHLERDLPAGYSESVAAGRNLIQDPALARLYDDVRLVTTGPLFSAERWRAIVRLNRQRGPGA
jgi:arabinofuranosyltransferase